MNIIIKITLIIPFLCWVIALAVQRHGLSKNGKLDQRNPREYMIENKYDLTNRANNTMKHIEEQSFFFYLPMVFVYTNVTTKQITNKICIIYIIGRILHTFGYLIDLVKMRHLGWFMQLVGIIWMNVLILGIHQ